MVLCVQGLNGMEALLDPLSDGGGHGTCVDGSVDKGWLRLAPAQLSHRSRFFGSARLPEPAVAGSGYGFHATDTLHQVMPP